MASRNPTAVNLGNLGMVYHSSAYYDKALVCYQLAIKRNKSAWIWNYYLGYLNEEMGESKAAIGAFSDVIKKNPVAYHAWYYIGEGYQKLGLNDKAESAYNNIAYLQENTTNVKTIRVNYFPLAENAKFQLSRIYLNTNRIDEAEKLLKEIISYNHTYSPVYRLLGNVYALRGDSALSKRYVLRAKDQADYTPLLDTLVDKLAVLSRSELYLPKQIDDAVKSANPEWATQLQNNALTYLPDNKYIISKAVKFFLRMDIGKNALPYLKKHMQLYSDSYNEMKELADLLFKKNYISQALMYYNQASKLKPEEPEIKSSMALCTWKLGNPEKAAGMMIDLVEKNPGNVKILANGIDFMIILGKKEKAGSWLNKLSQLAPANPKIPKIKGTIAEKEGNFPLAIQMYEQALKKEPDDIATVQALGSIFLEQKLWDKSIHLFRQALEFHPNEPFLLERLGALLVSCPEPKLRNMTEGKEFSERAFYSIASSSLTILAAGRNLVQAYAVEGDFDAARFYMNVTLSMAKSGNVPKEYLESLENLAKKLGRFSPKKSAVPTVN
jgi:tetratricopeptide (TPR) repeat protein